MTAPEEALEPALRALVEQSRAVAGAVCLFDPDHGALRLAAEVGLSDEGCHLLRTVRLESGGWLAPLLSLLDRRVCVLEASDPAGLPPLVDAAGFPSTVACVPVYVEDQPCASVILVGSATEEALRDLAPALAEVGQVVAAIHRRVAMVAPRGTEGASVFGSIIETVLHGIEPAVREARRVLQSTRRLAVAGLAGAISVVDPSDNSVRPAERLRQSESTVRALRAACREFETVALEREAEVEAHWQARLAEAASAWAHELERERGRLQEGLREAIERERQMGEEVAAVIERSAAEREETLRRALETTQEAETARAAAVVETQTLAAALAEVRAARLAAEEEAHWARNEIERLAASAEMAGTERERLRAEHQEARGREETVRARLAELEGKQGRLVGELGEAVSRERQMGEELAAVIERSAAEREETLRRALETTQEAETARAAAVAEAQALAAALAEARAARLAAQDEAQRGQAEVERLAAIERAAVLERQQLASALEEARRQEAEARTGLAGPVAATTLPVGRAAKLTPAGPSARSPARAASVVAVLDLNPAWEAADHGGHRVVVLSPAADLGERLAELDPALVLANLAGTGVLEAMAALRASGYFAPFWGFLAAPGTDQAIALGTVDLATRPVDPDAVLAAIALYTRRGTRVLLAGADANAFLSVRQALVREGMSVSIAWDAKQVEDLLPMVRPEVAIVDLGLPPRGRAYGTVAGLATVNPVPTTILIPSGDDAAGFAAALASHGRGSHALSLKELLEMALHRGHDARPRAPANNPRPDPSP